MAKEDFEDFLSRITFAESRGKRTDSSGKLLEGPMTKYGTAKGELQVLDSTNKRPGYGVVSAKDDTPDERARVGRDYLKAMLDKFKDKRTAAIAYNWGPGNTQKWLDAGADEAGLPLETQNYVKKVMGTAVAKAPAPPDMAPAPRQAAGAPSVPGAPANRPVVSRETVGPGTKETTVGVGPGTVGPGTQGAQAEDRLSALGPSYQAAMALSYLADTTNPAPQEEDEDGELRISGDEPRSTAREDDDVTNFLMEPSARTALADFDFKIQSPFAERPVKRMSGGGDPSRSVMGAKMLQRPAQPPLREQYPEVYGGLTAFMGIAPDEMGGSILDPNTARVRAGAEYGFPVGTAAQMIPAMGLLAPAVKATARAISTATPGPASGSRAAQLGVVKLPGGNFIKGNYPGSVEHSLDQSLFRSWGQQQGAPVDDWIDNTLVKYIKTDMGTSRDPVRLGIESRIAKAEADKLTGEKRVAKMQADIEKAKAGGKNTELSEERMRQEIERQKLAYESSVKHAMHIETSEGALRQRDSRRSMSDFPVAAAEAKTPASSIWETATDYAIGKPSTTPWSTSFRGNRERLPQYAEDYLKKPYGLYKDAPDLRPIEPKDPFVSNLIDPQKTSVKDIWNAFKERFGPTGRARRSELEANREIGRVADRANYEGRIEENPWLATVPPKTPVYSYGNTEYAYRSDPARFGVLVRELKNAMDPESGLPAELLLKTMPKTMDDAVAHVGKINAWREFNFTPKQMAASNNSATFFVKDYPDAGLKWVELKLPNMSETLPEGWTLNKSGNTLSAVSDKGAYVSGADLPSLIKNLYKEHPNTLGREDALKEALKFEGGTMKHCVGEADCEALAMGNKRIFSLRDSKERPHVTIEVKPLSEENPQLSITQIRGPANSKPKTKYDPQVQDFVLGNEFGVSADMRNVDFLDKFLSNTYNKSTAQYIKTMDEGLTADEIKTIFREQENVPGLADGGEARQMLEKLLPNRAQGSPEEGEVSQEELDAASKPSFRAQSSGINRQRGPISDALASGEAYTAAAKGFTNLPYNIAGAPMDLAMIVRQGLTGQAPAGQVGTSDWIKNKMTELGIRQAPPTDPTLKGFYELGDLGSNLVNPAAPVRGAVKVAEKTGEAAKMLAKDFQQYNRQLEAPGASYAVRAKGTPVVMSPPVREPTPDIMTDNFLLSMDKTGENAFFAKYPDIASWEYKQIRNTPEFKNFSASFLAPRDEVADLLDGHITQSLAQPRIGGPPVSVDPALNNWFLKTFSRYLRSDFASPSDQLVRAAEEGKLLHLAPKELWFDNDANRELVKYLGKSQPDLKNTREAEGFPKYGMAKTEYGQRIEDLTDLSAYPESIEELSPFKVPISMRGLVATNPEARAMDFSPDMVKNLKLDELRDKMLEIRQSGGKYSAYGQPAVKIPPEFLLPDDTLAKLNVAAASNRVARFTGWQEEARQGMATTALRTDPRFRRDLSSDGKYISVFIPDLAKPANQELIGIVTDVGCDGGWCTMREGNALGYGSGDRSLSIVLTNDGKKARPVAQVSVESRGTRGSSKEVHNIVDIAGKNNSYDFANNPALPAIQEHVKNLDYIYGGLSDIAYLKQLGMMRIPRDSQQPAGVIEFGVSANMRHVENLLSSTTDAKTHDQLLKHMTLLKTLYGDKAEGLRRVVDEAVKLNEKSSLLVGNEDTMSKLLQQALQNLTTPQKRATGGFMERQSNDNRKYL